MIITVTNTGRVGEPQGDFGIVYRWHDRLKNKYYIGSHWHSKKCKFPQTGTCNYVCSSRHMKNAYQKRPDDFTKEILVVVTTSREDLLRQEQWWLDTIHDSQFGKGVYNLNKTAKGWKLPKEVNSAMRKKDWAADRERREKQGITMCHIRRGWANTDRVRRSECMRLKWQDPIYRAKQLAGASERRKKQWLDPAYRAAISAASRASQLGRKRGPYRPRRKSAA
jgi:hypothetical protein